MTRTSRIDLKSQCSSAKSVASAAVSLSSRGSQGTVIVAVFTVGMVEMPSYQIIDMIPMWHLFMPAVRAVSMCGIVRLALMVGRAAVRV